MKKSVLVIALAFGVTGAFAQDLTSKKGEPILPEAGDYAISIDATPFLTYAGGFFSDAGATAPTWNFLSGQNVILGKYFKDEKTAYRAGLRLGFVTNKDAFLTDAIPGTTPASKVEDTRKVNTNNIGLTGGIEMRRGKTRLQGYYGGELGISFGTGKTTYEYGNAVTATNTSNNNNFNAADDGVTEIKQGTTFGLGVRGFIGAEYFIFPKISLGGEFGWGIGILSTGEGETTTQGWNGTAVESNTTKVGKSSDFVIDTDNINNIFGSAASIRLAFHF